MAKKPINSKYKFEYENNKSVLEKKIFKNYKSYKEYFKKLKITRIGKILNSRHKSSIIDKNGHKIKISNKGYIHTFD